MNFKLNVVLFFLVGIVATSCVSKKKFVTMQSQLESTNKELEVANKDLARYERSLKECDNKLAACNAESEKLKSKIDKAQAESELRLEQIKDLKLQVDDFKSQRDKQFEQVGDLTVLTQSASDNIKATLDQLQKKDKYITLLQMAKTKADSINLALAVNLKGVLKEGLDDKDIDIKVDKTVVFINLSDKMLYNSGSATLTPKANDVLAKIAAIVASRPELEVMVEGYTDNIPIKNSCMEDNWDLSVKRATSVVRALQTKYGVDPNRLIAAGRGEYNALVPNDSYENRATNRRTRIIILPKLNQFYDLLNPTNIPK